MREPLVERERLRAHALALEPVGQALLGVGIHPEGIGPWPRLARRYVATARSAATAGAPVALASTMAHRTRAREQREQWDQGRAVAARDEERDDGKPEQNDRGGKDRCPPPGHAEPDDRQWKEQAEQERESRHLPEQHPQNGRPDAGRVDLLVPGISAPPSSNRASGPGDGRDPTWLARGVCGDALHEEAGRRARAGDAVEPRRPDERLPVAAGSHPHRRVVPGIVAEVGLIPVFDGMRTSSPPAVQFLTVTGAIAMAAPRSSQAAAVGGPRPQDREQRTRAGAFTTAVSPPRSPVASHPRPPRSAGARAAQ